MAKAWIAAGDLDRKIAEGADISELVDWTKARRANLEARRVKVEFPA